MTSDVGLPNAPMKVWRIERLFYETVTRVWHASTSVAVWHVASLARFLRQILCAIQRDPIGRHVAFQVSENRTKIIF